jgi:hypothetical protein
MAGGAHFEAAKVLPKANRVSFVALAGSNRSRQKKISPTNRPVGEIKQGWAGKENT